MWGLSTEQLIIYIISFFSLLLIIWVVRLELKLKKLMRGKNAGSLEESWNNLLKEFTHMEKFRDEVSEYLKDVESRLSKSIQGVHSLSFNAFTGLDSGGQSSATAFVNENGEGVIISTLNAREKVNVFAKPIKDWKCHIMLSDEEAEALTKAKNFCNL